MYRLSANCSCCHNRDLESSKLSRETDPFPWSIWISKEAQTIHTYLFAGLELIFSVTEFTFLKGQNVTANWCLQSELKIPHFHRTIRMGRCYHWRASHHCDREKSAVHQSLNPFLCQEERSTWRQRRWFLSRRESSALGPIWMNTNMHDLKEEKLH